MSAIIAVAKVKTAMDLRKLMARTALTQLEIESCFENLPSKEVEEFFRMLNRKGIDTPELYIQWLKSIKVL